MCIWFENNELTLQLLNVMLPDVLDPSIVLHYVARCPWPLYGLTPCCEMSLTPYCLTLLWDDLDPSIVLHCSEMSLTPVLFCFFLISFIRNSISVQLYWKLQSENIYGHTPLLMHLKFKSIAMVILCSLLTVGITGWFKWVLFF